MPLACQWTRRLDLCLPKPHRPVWYSLFRLRVTLADMILVQPRRLSLKVQRRFLVLARLNGRPWSGLPAKLAKGDAPDRPRR